jgi:hypothetical protein
MTQISKKLERVQLTDTKVELIMPERILNQIKYLCRDIAKVEWSGVLFYSMVGSIAKPEELVLTIEDILPMNKGTATYTEYTFDDSVVEYMMDNETMEKGWKMGHIHSHNTMSVFFSGTDWSELEDNAPNHNFYLSLIVNNFMDFCAKVCFIAESEDNRELAFYSKNENGERYLHSSKAYDVVETQLVSYDCDIKSPLQVADVDDAFKKRVENIIKAAEVRAIPVRPLYTSRTTIMENKNLNSSVSAQGGRSWSAVGFQRGLVEKKEEKIEVQLDDESITAFALYILNTGHDTSSYDNSEELLEYYKSYNLSGTGLAGNVLAKYAQMYATFFKDLPHRRDDSTFVEVTESLIQELEGEIYLAKDRVYVESMISPVIKGLERLLVNFEAYLKTN